MTNKSSNGVRNSSTVTVSKKEELSELGIFKIQTIIILMRGYVMDVMFTTTEIMEILKMDKRTRKFYWKSIDRFLESHKDDFIERVRPSEIVGKRKTHDPGRPGYLHTINIDYLNELQEVKDKIPKWILDSFSEYYKDEPFFKEITEKMSSNGFVGYVKRIQEAVVKALNYPIPPESH